jgi:hypothetical protein
MKYFKEEEEESQKDIGWICYLIAFVLFAIAITYMLWPMF